MSRSARFRELLRNPPFVCLGAHDFGVLTQTEMFEHIRRICRVTRVPVFAGASARGGAAADVARRACGRGSRLKIAGTAS